MEKVWYIRVFEMQEGPYTLNELMGDMRITPDTYVWKVGFEKWVKAGDVPELEVLFEDKEEENPLKIEEKLSPVEDELVLEMRGAPLDPNLFPFLLLIIFLITILLVYQLSS